MGKIILSSASSPLISTTLSSLISTTVSLGGYNPTNNTLTANNATISITTGTHGTTLIGNGNTLNIANGSSATTQGDFLVKCGNSEYIQLTATKSFTCDNNVLTLDNEVIEQINGVRHD